jgi:hypothetical protein
VDVLTIVTILGFAAVVYSLWDIFEVIKRVGNEIELALMHQDSRDEIKVLGQKLDTVIEQLKERQAE